MLWSITWSTTPPSQSLMWRISGIKRPTLLFILMSLSSHSTRLLAATTLRNVLGTKNLSEILSEREVMNNIFVYFSNSTLPHLNMSGHLSCDAERSWWGHRPVGSQSWKSWNVSFTYILSSSGPGPRSGPGQSFPAKYLTVLLIRISIKSEQKIKNITDFLCWAQKMYG